jgi:hypothetical protein
MERYGKIWKDMERYETTDGTDKTDEAQGDGWPTINHE